MLKIYDTKLREKVPFETLKHGEISMYVCGPTVYNYIHIGNARTFVSFDIIRRYLSWRGFKVKFVSNITDVDDKIIKKANEEGRTAAEVAAEYSQAFLDDMHALNVEDPDVRPRATEEIPDMIQLIQELIDGGHAYEVEGDVYFSVRSYPDYGALSGRNIDEMEGGHRELRADGQGLEDRKRDPLDFALWKAAKPGEPSWKSPWGEGRPGWHTECAAMVHRYLGVPIDIHGGGSDLAFPHHENECAQATCAWHQGFSNTWMHTGMLLVNGEKMSKSLGNFFTLEEVLEKHSAAALRLLMLQTHYRSPLDFSFERLEGAESSLARIAGTAQNLRWAAAHATGEPDAALAQKLADAVAAADAEFKACMNDDFNTAGALGVFFGFITEANSYLDAADGAVNAEVVVAAAEFIERSMDVLGIELPEQEAELPVEIIALAAERAGYAGDDTAEAAEALIAARAEARAAKDWAVADAIRDALGELGLVVEDTAAGARVKAK